MSCCTREFWHYRGPPRRAPPARLPPPGGNQLSSLVVILWIVLVVTLWPPCKGRPQWYCRSHSKAVNARFFRFFFILCIRLGFLGTRVPLSSRRSAKLWLPFFSTIWLVYYPPLPSHYSDSENFKALSKPFFFQIYNNLMGKGNEPFREFNTSSQNNP